ncbi:hypothetical protein K1719_009436 [Acacia pycnantha]|nr:hypothetical protein K1719_009436 [Acacia pycnantha]
MALREKDLGPQLSEEELRSTKKVQIRSEEVSDGLGEGSKGTDTEMPEPGLNAGFSYRSKLLNGAQTGGVNQEQLEVNLTEKDYKVDREGDIPCIDFSRSIRALLAKGMERSLVIKLLGRSITYHDLVYRTQILWRLKGSYHLVDMDGGFYCATFDLDDDYYKVLTGGPWMIYVAYLTTQPWSLEFDSKTTVVSKVVAWVRIRTGDTADAREVDQEEPDVRMADPTVSAGASYRIKAVLASGMEQSMIIKLNGRSITYQELTNRTQLMWKLKGAIWALLGEAVKIDYMTESRGREKYARIAVIVDLLKPLIPCIKVDGKSFYIEYEGLPQICFKCGKYVHLKDRCGVVVQPSVDVRTHGHVSTNIPPSDLGGSKVNGGSSFNVLNDCEDMPLADSQPNKKGVTRIEEVTNPDGGSRTIDQNLSKGPSRSKPTSHGAKSGHLRQAQVYRPKVKSIEKDPSLLNNNRLEEMAQARSQDVAAGSGVSPIDKPCHVGVLTRTVEPENKL